MTFATGRGIPPEHINLTFQHALSLPGPKYPGCTAFVHGSGGLTDGVPGKVNLMTEQIGAA
jgi:hypothetical protein